MIPTAAGDEAPFDSAQGKPLDSAQRKPFDSAQGKPFDPAQGKPGQASEPTPVRWTAAAEARLANIPAFVRPMARTGIEQFARERGALEVDEKILDAAREFFGM
jgi:hypothetical protein